VAGAETEVPDGLVKARALGSHGATLGVVRKTFRGLARAPYPIACRAGRLFTDVAIGRSKIALGGGSDDNAVSHLPASSRSSSSNTSSAGRPAPLRACARPRRMLATASS